MYVYYNPCSFKVVLNTPDLSFGQLIHLFGSAHDWFLQLRLVQANYGHIKLE